MTQRDEVIRSAARGPGARFPLALDGSGSFNWQAAYYLVPVPPTTGFGDTSPCRPSGFWELASGAVQTATILRLDQIFPASSPEQVDWVMAHDSHLRATHCDDDRDRQGWRSLKDDRR